MSDFSQSILHPIAVFGLVPEEKPLLGELLFFGLVLQLIGLFQLQMPEITKAICLLEVFLVAIINDLGFRHLVNE